MDDFNDVEIEHNSETANGGVNAWLSELHPQAHTAGWYLKFNTCSFVYVERDKSTLVVSFDNLLDANNSSPERLPWGYKFFAKFQYSHLGVMVNQANWFRDQIIIDQLEKLKRDGFFDQFKTVAFTGTSMGAFAALVFSRLVPGCNVIVFSPQTTLDLRIVPWENRFPTGQNQNWDMGYSDAAQGLETANRVAIIYDPLNTKDRLQVERIPKLPNIDLHLLPACGHKTPVILKRLNGLAYAQKAGIHGELEVGNFRKLARGRRYLIVYKSTMMHLMEKKFSKEVIERWGEAFKKRNRQFKRSQTATDE